MSDSARAHGLVRSAIKSGRLKRKPCEECGAAEAHAHHDDYSKPLDVRWLCRKHHARAHPPVKLGGPREIVSWSQIRNDPEGIEEPVIVVKMANGVREVLGAWYPAWLVDELEGRET